MPEFIRWEPMTRQEGWHGFLGEVRRFALIPWASEKERSPWQLQNLRSEMIPRNLFKPREAPMKRSASRVDVALFLMRAHLIPATDEQLDAVIPSYRNREAEQDPSRRLRETG